MSQSLLYPIDWSLTERQEDQISKAWVRFVRLQNDLEYVNKHEPSYWILSFGAGRQTVALLLLLTPLFKNNPNAYVIFADTGSEHQATYDYIQKYIGPYCKENNINYVRVYNKYNKPLYDYCWDKKIVPSMKFRDCTSKFKIAPIRYFLRKVLGVTRANPAFMFIGISADEAHRMNVSSVKYAKNIYPFVDGFRDLVQAGTTIEDCKDSVWAWNQTEVPKSGCFMCPYARPKDLINPLYKEKNIALEENNSRFPEIKLTGLKNVKSVREMNPNDIALDTCKSGYCMV